MEDLPVKTALTILLVMLLTACGGPATPESPASQKPPQTMWKSQLEMLDKAKQLDQIVQKQAAEQRRRLDAMTR
jgi:type IV pilus biogenesis protein CpaD/CtpE